ncbi:MAG: TrkA family potassium uptake protein [Deltaproteobacteria bacterium]|nr:TrkA family potassium uptake protein [Deltaproteobacteria bacterium]
MKKHAVIGLGKFGMTMALELSRLGRYVIAIDGDPDRAKAVQPEVDKAMVSDATQRDNLVAMGVDKMDVVVVSLGGSMDAVTRVVLHLTRLGVPQIVAKALDEDHAEILRRIGATHVVFPEQERAFQLARRLCSENVLYYLSLPSGFSLVELAPSKRIVGRSLAELDPGKRYGVQVLAVKELVPERTVISPGADHKVKDSDILVVIGPEEGVKRMREA